MRTGGAIGGWSEAEELGFRMSRDFSFGGAERKTWDAGSSIPIYYLHSHFHPYIKPS